MVQQNALQNHHELGQGAFREHDLSMGPVGADSGPDYDAILKGRFPYDVKGMEMLDLKRRQ